MSATLPPLSLSILGVEPLDEFILEVANFVHHTIIMRPSHLSGNIEVEVKIGLLKDRSGSDRISLPTLSETILAPKAVESRFESNMTPAQHKHFNNLLNKLKLEPQPGVTPLEYRHLYLLDTFYDSDQPGSREKTRMTRDEKSGNVVECVKKIRLGNLDIYSPKRHADWRVSVNIEVPVPLPQTEATRVRRKDRLSYTHEEMVIDLTQVTSTGASSTTDVLHELEIEIASSDLLLATAAKRGNMSVPEHERSAFDELIRVLVNNARILTKNALGDGWN